ncbi:uncharacterized protein LAESUDRAFT_657451 [Laetiporus sulphureus 93-53]|uniref:Uncharacterized protein n=1 Tax=Laetiporus sulphureus 93-53 TaxID=1314785 RepID=A0A165DE12_9APHY|nr:uncharacterized protein LAESUDRAFT_657451 [Laetiporus sulphureus 93-53]KZT04675.1 hypothetical protein LAESUDRAFT_657451 [Laetiporus sulphureus 93-53]
MGWFDQPSAFPQTSPLRPAHYTGESQEQTTPVADSSGRPTFGPFARAQQQHKREHEPAGRARAVFIFLRSIGRIFLLNGTDYTFHLPFVVRRAWPLSPHGVLLQRVLDPMELEEVKASGDVALPTSFTFINALAEPAAVGITTKLTGGFNHIPVSIEEDDPIKSINFVPAEEQVVWISQRVPESTDDIIITINTEKRQFSIWRYAFIRPKEVPTAPSRPQPVSAVNKRTSMSATPAQKRQVIMAPPQTAPAGSVSGVPRNLSTPAPMTALVGVGATMEHAASVPAAGRSRQDSISRLDLSVAVDKTSGGFDGEILLDPVVNARMQTAYWVEKLHCEQLPERSTLDPSAISVGLFDQRWDGEEHRSLIGICFPAAETLLVYRLSKDAGHIVAKFEGRLEAVSISSVRATRELIQDLLIVKLNGKMSLLTHGLRELPLSISTDVPKGASEKEGYRETPCLTARPLINCPIISVSDPIESTVTLTFANRASVRIVLDLMPRDLLTRQCLLMLAMVIPADEFFALHSNFLRRWAAKGQDLSFGVSFACLVSALYEVFELETEPAPRQIYPAITPGPWLQIHKTSSAFRFREDPILRKLRPPPSVQPATTLPRPKCKPRNLIAPILIALHNVAEDMRLMIHRYRDLLKLVPVVCRVAMHVRPEWADYWKRLCPDAMENWPAPGMTVVENVDDRLSAWPLDSVAILYGRISNPEWFPPVPESHKIAQGFDIKAAFAFGNAEPLLCSRQLTDVYVALADSKVPQTRKRAENGLQAMVRARIGADILRWVPLGIAAPLKEACRTCQLSPSGDWPPLAHGLIGRNDLAEMSSPHEQIHVRGYRSVRESMQAFMHRKSFREHIDDTWKAVTGETNVVSGVELDVDDLTQIRFGQDRRLEEIARMLCSSTVPTIRAIERPELSEHDQAKEQQLQVVRMAERTLALPLGRAMFTFGSVPTVTRQAYAIPKIEYAVRLQPMNALITPEPGKIPVECTSWGEFHNGVAAGLRISAQSNAVESTWIKFNKPSELTPEHAGFLYALGLTGHLREMLTWHTFSYLTPKHDMTSIGVLLGLSAANVGTGNLHVTKLIAVHTPALLPTPSMDLNVPLITQAAGLIGIGLLYMGTQNRRMAEVCLSQISRKDLCQPDLSNEYREAYTFSAALACGMVMLGKGGEVPADLVMLSRLRVLIHGERHPSFSVDEQPTFDINLTSPAATITLGLMYLRSGRQDVADILAIPDTLLALNSIQPSFLLMRTLARCLIMWDKIAPSKEWLQSQVPQAILAAVNDRYHGKSRDDAYELAYYNILAGLCFAIGLKYAGTAREEAYLLIITHYDMFSQVAYTNSTAFDHRIKRAAIRDGLNLISISLAMVLAGTGEINCLRRLRYAYGMNNQFIRYGTHVANHMSLGLLFLGGGRFTLGTSDAAIACMVAAFFPRFANVSSDNKSYLQALRHLWVLATEPRCLIARDVDTKEVVYIPVKIKTKDGQGFMVSQLLSPTLIPDIDKVLSIRIDTPRYWPFYLDVANNPRHRESLLRNQTLFVKRRTAFLSYKEDTKGSRSLFVRSGSSPSSTAMLDFPQLTDLKIHPAGDLHEFIASFSNDPLFISFADRFCRDDGETEEERRLQAYCHASLLDSILQDKSQTIQAHLTVYRYRQMHSGSSYFVLRMQDLRFATEFYSRVYERRFSGRSENNARSPLIRESTLSGALLAIDRHLDTIRTMKAFVAALSHYAQGDAIPVYPKGSSEWKCSRHLSWYLQRNSVPVSSVLAVLKALARKAHRDCLAAPPPAGTTDVARLDRGIKEVVYFAGTSMTTSMGSGWSLRSLDEVVAAWCLAG